MIRLDHRRAAKNAFYGKPESRRCEVENEKEVDDKSDKRHLKAVRRIV